MRINSPWTTAAAFWSGGFWSSGAKNTRITIHEQLRAKEKKRGPNRKWWIVEGKIGEVCEWRVEFWIFKGECLLEKLKFATKKMLASPEPENRINFNVGCWVQDAAYIAYFLFPLIKTTLMALKLDFWHAIRCIMRVENIWLFFMPTFSFFEILPLDGCSTMDYRGGRSLLLVFGVLLNDVFVIGAGAKRPRPGLDGDLRSHGFVKVAPRHGGFSGSMA